MIGGAGPLVGWIRVATVRRSRLLLAMLGLAAVAVLAAIALRQPAAPPAYSASVVDYLAANTGQAGFARVLGPRPLAFPADSGPHDAYQTEWWYYTGNLGEAGGRRYGFQLTFFRRALTPQASARGSAWGTNQVYL